MYLVIYAPKVMAADLPENYAGYPQEFRFIRDVPTDWADTRVLNGEIGDHATIAHRDRRSRDWYIGSVTDEQARSVTVTLDFLDPGRGYTAQIYRDGPGADYRTAARHSIAVETRRVRRGDRLVIAMAPGAGQAVQLKAD